MNALPFARSSCLLAAGMALAQPAATPERFYALEHLATGTVTRRGTTAPDGIPDGDVILAPNTRYRHWLCRPEAGLIGFVEFETPSSGRRFTIPPVPLGPSNTGDHDQDGLPDDFEFVVGTDPAKADSDGDGIADGAAIALGLDPGAASRTGIVGTVDTPGAAVAVCALNDVVVVADSEQGMSVFNVFNRMNPVIIAQVDTPGVATAVACAGNLVVVADGPGGVAIIDLSDPPAAAIRHQVLQGSTARAVVAGGTLAYVGIAPGQIAVVDLIGGGVLSRVTVPGEVQDLALGGRHLYALTGERLHVLEGLTGPLRAVSAVDSPWRAPTPNRRLFVGGDLAYAVHGRGYNTFSLTNPALPSLIAAGNTAQLGWRQIVANGSGLGVAAVNPNAGLDGPNDVSLYDLRDPTKTDVFLTTLPTPGVAGALAIYNGLAYVADGAAGLQIVNYLAFDTAGQPPTVVFEPDFDLTTPTRGEVQEGRPVRVTARVTDDVQVRNVEFYLDEQLAVTDGNFPFEYRFTTPRIVGAQNTFRLRARASDTGGNAAWTDELLVRLTPDTEAPRITRFLPVGGGPLIDHVLVFFDEPLDPASLATADLRVGSAGADGLPGTPDDLEVAGGEVRYRGDLNAVALVFPGALPEGRYQAVLSGTLRDLAGNTLAPALAWSFRVAEAVFWTGLQDGSWHDAANWSSGAVPGPDDAVYLEVPGTNLVARFSEGAATVKALVTEETVLVAGGALRVTEPWTSRQTIQLDGGTIRATAIHLLDGARLVASPSQNNRLDAAVVNGDLDLTMPGARLAVTNSLTLNGTAYVGNSTNTGSAAITFEGSQSLVGSGTVRFGGGGPFNTLRLRWVNTTLTLGPGIVVAGQRGSLGYNPFYGQPQNVTVVNQGTILGEGPGTELDSRSETFVNAGTIEVRPGSIVRLDRQWSNAGRLRLLGGVLELGAVFSPDELGQLEAQSGTLRITGVYDNAGATFELGGTEVAMRLSGGTVRGGVLNLTAGARLQCDNDPNNRLDGVLLNGLLDLTIETGARAVITNGLTLNGTAYVGNPTNQWYAGLLFAGTQTLAGTGEVVFGSNNSLRNVLQPTLAGTALTLGPGITLRGINGTVGYHGLWNGHASTAVTNLGTISADTAEGVFRLEARPWINLGRVRAPAGIVELGGVVPAPALGTIDVADGRLRLVGTLDNAGHHLTLHGDTNTLTLRGGTLLGGTLSLANGARLIGTPQDGRLDGVTLNGDLDLTAFDSQLFVTNGLTLNGTVALGHPSINWRGALTFQGTQTLAGQGTVVFGLASCNVLRVATAGASLTLGPDLTVRGRSGQIGYTPGCVAGPSNVGLINQGTIVADVAGGTITIRATPFVNEGSTGQSGGGTLVINP